MFSMRLACLRPSMLAVALLMVLPNLHSAARPTTRPRLILTPQRIAELKASTVGARAEMWKAALESADDFSRAPVPAMTRAGNQFRYVGDTMPALGLAYWMTGERRYIEAAERWLRAVVAVPDWSGSANLGRSSWVLGAAFLYDWVHDVMNEDLKAAVRKRLETEGDLLTEDGPFYWRLLSNHCLIETSALGTAALALEGDSDAADRFLRKARERTERIIEHAPLDGAWSEGVQYWEYGLTHFVRYLEALKTSGVADYYPRYDWFKKTGYFRIYFSLPGSPGNALNFGDCCDERKEHRWDAAFLLYKAAAAYRNGHFQSFGNSIRTPGPYKFSWMDFVMYDPTVVPIDYRSLPPGTHLEDSGYFMMRTSWQEDATVIGFRCGPAPGHRNQEHPLRLAWNGFGPGHQHPDINNFMLYAYGQRLAIDPGYAHPKWTADHNTVLVNGRGQAGEGHAYLDYMAFENRSPQPSILHTETNAAYDYVIGDAGNIYVDEADLKHYRRNLLFLKPDIVVIADDLEAKRPSTFEWLLNALHSITRVGQNGFEIQEGGVRLWVHPISPRNCEADIRERAYRASNVDGKLVTLNLRVQSVPVTRFLVVLAVLKDASVPVPSVTTSSGRLTIRHLGRSWDLRVIEAARLAGPADPVLQMITAR
jgi:hypothetical protein